MKMRKLLPGLAITLAIIGIIVAETRDTSSLDFYLQDIYFVVEAPFGILFLGLLAVVAHFAVVYFSPHRFNHYLGLAGFIFVLAACSIFIIVSAQRSQQEWPYP